MALHIGNENQLNQLLQSKKLVVVDFTATWCGPCKMIAPIFEKLANQYKVDAAFVTVDVDQHKDIAHKYSVSAMPTFIFFKNGSQVDMLRGADANSLQQMAAKHAPAQMFQGKGNVLGDPNAASHASHSNTSSTPDEKKKHQGLCPPLNQNSPVCTIQLRTTTGEAFVLQFNTATSLQSLFSVVSEITKTPAHKFNLFSSHVYPPKMLAQRDTTFEGAGCVNCSIIQKMI